MKAILILTDFSKAAMNAADAALLFTKHYTHKLILLNTFITVPIIPSAETATWQTEDFYILQQLSQDNLRSEKQRLRKNARLAGKKHSHSLIETVSAFGDVADQINILATEQVIDLIVLGCHDKGHHVFFLVLMPTL